MRADATRPDLAAAGRGTDRRQSHDPSSPAPSSLDGCSDFALTCEHAARAGSPDAPPRPISLERGRRVWRRPFSQRIGCLDQGRRRAGTDRRDHGAQHVDSALGHSHLNGDGAGSGLALAVFTSVFAVAFATRIDALAHLGCGERIRLGHGRVFHVMLTCQLHMWALDGDKSTCCGAEVDLQKNHYRSVLPSVLAGAKDTKVHGSIMGPVLDTEWRDRVSEGLRG